MKIFITGICGFVGSTLAKTLRKDFSGFEIFGIDNFSRPGSWLNKESLERLGIQIFHGDIRQESDLISLPKADWVIDAAANPSVLAGVDGKTSSLQLIQNNLFGTINLLEYCKKHGSGFVLLSTSRVYSIPGLAALHLNVVNDAYAPDPAQQFPNGITVQGVSETYSTSPPVSLYGSTKVCSEHLALEYGETFDFPVWINRCGVLAGPGQFGHPGQGIFAYWIHSFREKKPLKYIGFGGTGYQVRDVLHPKDIVSLLIKQFGAPRVSPAKRIVNLGGGIASTMSLKNLSKWCEDRFGANKPLETKEVRPFDIGWMVLNNNEALKEWKWAPQTKVHDILEEIANFAVQNEDWLRISRS